jgi:hypothetical protein
MGDAGAYSTALAHSPTFLLRSRGAGSSGKEESQASWLRGKARIWAREYRLGVPIEADGLERIKGSHGLRA